MQRFTEEEAQEILRRAVQAPLEEYTQDDLQRSAAELGISPEALARAEAEVREERVRKEFELSLRGAVRKELMTFLGVMALLVAINLFTSPHHIWFIYPLFFWGLSIAGTFVRSRDRRGERYQRAFKNWQEMDGKLSDTALAEILSKR